MSAVLFTVHGKVQGVGYRQFVLSCAIKSGIKGMVRNMPSGSVEILAIGESEQLEKFSKEIEVDTENGPQVMKVEKKVLDSNERILGKTISAYSTFTVEKSGI